ncbi:hypothetical protein [Aquirhabdus sp.]|uniref:hypothetical protein n=1 Tax=Aquirhabdus sp. TaxID=2824160 RepID=UPI00396C6568
MTIKIFDWPVVQMHFTGHVTSAEFHEWLMNTTLLMARAVPFSVVTSSAVDLSLPEDYRKQEAIWYKANKDLLSQSCKGIARVVHDEQQFAQFNSKAMHHAWPCPFFVSLSLHEAISWAEQQLKL